MRTPDAIRAHRSRLRLTQAELARDIGVDPRQINRYETGETEPTLAVARRLAERLGISMDGLAGEAAPLNGVWISAWHNLDAEMRTGAVELTQQGHHLNVKPLRTSSEGAPDLAIAWNGEFYVDGDTLLGGYKIETSTLSEGGLMNLTHREATLEGTWTRLALRGARTGHLCLARDLDTAVAGAQKLGEERPPT